MKVITTLSNKTSGSFTLFGNSDENLTSTKRRIGSLIENPAFFPNLTAEKNLKYYAIQKGIVDTKQIDEAIKLVGLEEARNKKFKTYSLRYETKIRNSICNSRQPRFYNPRRTNKRTRPNRN